MFIIFFSLFVIFLVKSNNLLLSLLVLEVIRFISIFIFSSSLSSVLFSDFFIIVFFSVFVIEGVIGLSGLIRLVRNTGSDYIRSNSLVLW